jgi:hypothetical protein
VVTLKGGRDGDSVPAIVVQPATAMITLISYCCYYFQANTSSASINGVCFPLCLDVYLSDANFIAGLRCPASVKTNAVAVCVCVCVCVCGREGGVL